MARLASNVRALRGFKHIPFFPNGDAFAFRDHDRKGEDQSFSPADPPIPLQSFTRAEPGKKAGPVYAPAKLVFSFAGRWMVAFCDLRVVHDLVAAVAILTHPTPGRAKTRPFPRWRWRDAVFEGPFGRSPGRTKLAEPSRDRVMRFHPSPEQRRLSTYHSRLCAGSARRSVRGSPWEVKERNAKASPTSSTPGGVRSRLGWSAAGPAATHVELPYLSIDEPLSLLSTALPSIPSASAAWFHQRPAKLPLRRW